MDRTINKTLVKDWYTKRGRDGIVRIAIKTKLSVSFLDKFFRLKYDHLPNATTMALLSSAMGHHLDDVFPLKLPVAK